MYNRKGSLSIAGFLGCRRIYIDERSPGNDNVRSMAVKHLLLDRNVILTLSVAMGLVWADGSRWTESLILPVLVVVMTFSLTDVTRIDFASPKALLGPALLGAAMNYVVLSIVILGLTGVLIRDGSFRIGFVLIAAVPPAVAVVPFTVFLRGDVGFSLMGNIGGYLAGLLLMPLIVLWFIGPGFVDSSRLAVTMLELIVAPLIVSRLLLWSPVSRFVQPIKGAVINWSFFILSYTIIGLNREALVGDPLILVPSFAVVLGSTILLSWVVEAAGILLRIEKKVVIPLVLLATLKNYGLAGGLALTLFQRRTAMPAAVASVVMVVYIVYLDLKMRRGQRKG